VIKTPLTHPDHQTVGKRFKAWDGCTYYCDSYDPAIGFWMTPDEGQTDCWGKAPNRRNVSERAVGRSYHRIYEELA